MEGGEEGVFDLGEEEDEEVRREREVERTRRWERVWSHWEEGLELGCC